MAESGAGPGVRLLPINRIAALKLREAGIAPDPEVQPVFQLMAWAIACDKRHRFQDIGDELCLLGASDGAAATQYLLERIPGGSRRFLQVILHAESLAAAKTLLGALDMRLKAEPYSPCRSYPNLPSGR